MQRKLEEEPVHRLAILTGIKQPTCLDVQEQANSLAIRVKFRDF